MIYYTHLLSRMLLRSSRYDVRVLLKSVVVLRFVFGYDLQPMWPTLGYDLQPKWQTLGYDLQPNWQTLGYDLQSK